jgi:ribosome-associated translation inhibitor RaiA
MKMNDTNFPIEFHNEVDEVKKSENEFFTLAVDRLSKLAGGRDDISGAVVNFKQPAQAHATAYIYEVTIVLYMASEHIAATEKGEQFSATLDSAPDAVERQVHERREKERSY